MGLGAIVELISTLAYDSYGKTVDGNGGRVNERGNALVSLGTLTPPL
jgi:hypothetical protein